MRLLKINQRCKTKGCRKEAKINGLCSSCRHEKEKSYNPLKYWYGVWVRNTRRRGIRNEVTLFEFSLFCIRTNYLEIKGRGAGRATIDRKNSNEHYYFGNMQILEHASNSRKVHIDRKLFLMYGSGQTPTQEELDEMKRELNSFGNEIDLYKPPPEYEF